MRCLRLGLAVVAVALVAACTPASSIGLGAVPRPGATACSQFSNDQLNTTPPSAEGFLLFPQQAGASATFQYAVLTENAGPTDVAFSTLTCFSAIPVPPPGGGTVQLAFTISVTSNLELATSINAVMPTGVTPSGGYNFEVFDGYSATTSSAVTFGAPAANTVSTLPGEPLVFNLTAFHTYIIEVVQLLNS